ncbi:LysR family transcriptional regulator [Alkalilacustris brevis]|uniref:LysR family transcriptional regulator n=1 Tax=Alkalilacustris brevis TaxID=2026338 RepID=UPI000E0D2D88|nr:LysR family transcriptional regulator [Alkalilacustris brevis]
MNLRTLDLNLIRVFHALMREGSVTRAGAQLGLSQPAVSSALGRLRQATGDPLFLRAGNSMVPTAQAQRLAPAVAEALAALERAFEENGHVDPTKLRCSFTLMGADFFSLLFMPEFSASVTRLAPQVRLRLLDAARGDIAGLLQTREIDVALEHLPDLPARVCSAPLFRSAFVIAASARNSQIAEAGVKPRAVLPMETFEKLDYAVYSRDGGESGCAVEVLESLGMGDRVALALPHFQATAQAAARSELAALLPCQLAEAVARPLGLRVYRTPVSLPVLELGMFWHEDNEHDPQHRWLRDRIASTMAALDFDACAQRYLH